MELLDGTQIGENHANLSMILDGARQLVVLLLEIYGVHGHDLFRTEKEEQPRVDASRYPSRLYADVRGHSTFFGLLNTFVHIVMYTYYLLAALGPRIQPYLWWKKYLTAFQMIQFIAIMVHAFQLLFIDCDYPKAFVWWIGMHAVMFFFLFNKFYQQNYQQKRTARKMASNGITNGRANGVISNGNISASNGTIRRDAADYYVKGESLAATEFNLRKGYLLNE
ncbi:hypothetical protein HZH68_001893 [Vespula germanica]|uniref:Elongation of very long chain fatty acids protein n=1 Tax=Vespula germanica TaxID=30212 RepID=A0A834NLY6_VESGE|nr:hypothetical protein HZH68_001893 [Vespula germanica]